MNEEFNELESTIPQNTQEELEATFDRQPYLIVVFGHDRGKSFALGAKTTIGRSPDADITVNDDRLSRYHCIVECQPSGITVTDNDSTNGTFIQLKRIKGTHKVPLNTNIHFGRSVVKIVYKDETEIKYEEELLKAAMTDALTGIPNRHWLMERTKDELSYIRRARIPISVLMIDVDFFKKVNDTYGHQAGDYCLMQLASLMFNAKRTEDLLARYGGEEFIIILKGVPLEGSQQICDRLRKHVENFKFIFDSKKIPITISMGLCHREQIETESIFELISRADQALYKAKQAGRNRVVTYKEP